MHLEHRPAMVGTLRCPPCEVITPAAFSAMNARQPPNAEISRAPSIAAGSTTKPFTPRPSASRMVPIPSGGGIAATNLPNAGRRQRPELQLDRISRACVDAQHAGLWRRGVERIELVVRRGRGGFFEQASAERLQFAVERHAGEMRADHGDGDFVAAGLSRQRSERRLRQAFGCPSSVWYRRGTRGRCWRAARRVLRAPIA